MGDPYPSCHPCALRSHWPRPRLRASNRGRPTCSRSLRRSCRENSDRRDISLLILDLPLLSDNWLRVYLCRLPNPSFSSVNSYLPYGLSSRQSAEHFRDSATLRTAKALRGACFDTIPQRRNFRIVWICALVIQGKIRKPLCYQDLLCHG